jgi:hypothetical protein
MGDKGTGQGRDPAQSSKTATPIKVLCINRIYLWTPLARLELDDGDCSRPTRMLRPAGTAH